MRLREEDLISREGKRIGAGGKSRPPYMIMLIQKIWLVVNQMWEACRGKIKRECLGAAVLRRVGIRDVKVVVEDVALVGIMSVSRVIGEDIALLVGRRVGSEPGLRDDIALLVGLVWLAPCLGNDPALLLSLGSGKLEQRDGAIIVQDDLGLCVDLCDGFLARSKQDAAGFDASLSSVVVATTKSTAEDGLPDDDDDANDNEDGNL
jgi:hypothetical protein